MSETSEPQLALIALEGLRREYGLTVQLRRDGQDDGRREAGDRSGGSASSLDELWRDVRRRRGTEVSPEWGMPSPVVRSIAAPPKLRRATGSRAFDFSTLERLTRRRPPATDGQRDVPSDRHPAAVPAADLASVPASGPAIADVWTARAVGPNGDDVWTASAPSAYEAVCRLAERLDESGIA